MSYTCTNKNISTTR